MKSIPFLRLPPLMVLVLSFLASAATAIEVPYLQGRVTDNAELLSPEATKRITSLLEQHENSTGNQVAILTMPSLEGESIESCATQVFDVWKLGQKERDNGVLVLIAPGERRMRIEVGYGLEGTLTDLKAGRIIRDIMTPRFKENDFDGGIEQGILAIISQLEGKGDLTQETKSPSEEQGEFMEVPDLDLLPRILLGCFIFGIIGTFTVLGILTPGMGWFLYFFLIPFWAMFPIMVVGVKATMAILVIYLIGFPATKWFISRKSWYQQARKDLKKKGRARIGGFTVSSGRGSWSSGSSSHSSGSSFSGGGGSSGGGGASGSW